MVIATKTPASSYSDAEKHIRLALKERDVDRLDIVLLHAHRLNDSVFEKRAGTHKCLPEYKAKGLIGAAGTSTHRVSVVETSAERDGIDLICRLINVAGLGILGGTVKDMARTISLAAQRGKGTYATKTLKGDHLMVRREEAFRFVLGLPRFHAAVVGMVSQAEVDMNCRIFSGENFPNRAGSDVQGQAAQDSPELL